MSLLKSKTSLSEREILNTIDFLFKTGLIERKQGRWIPTKKRIHISPEDPLIGVHHKNFRALAIKEMEEMKTGSVHYSSAMAISKVDALAIREKMMGFLSQIEKILRPSPEEAVRILSVDFFEPGNSIGH